MADGEEKQTTFTNFFPEGLSAEEMKEIEHCADRAGNHSIEALLGKAREHVQNIRDTFENNPLVDLPLAEALLGSIETVVQDWQSVP